MKGGLLLVLAFVVAAGLAKSGLPALSLLGGILILLAGINFLLGGARAGWKTLAVCVSAVLLLWGKGHPLAFWAALVVAILNFWSFGVMYNFKANPMAAPDSWTRVNLATAIVGLLLFSYGVIANLERYPAGP